MGGGRGCRSWRRALWAEVDGSLPAGRRARLLSHLARCPGCRAALEAARRIDRGLASEPLRAPSDEFEDEVLMKVMAGVARGPAFGRSTSPTGVPGEAGSDGDPMRRLDWWLLGGLAAVGLVAVGLGMAALLDALRVGAGSPSGAGDPTFMRVFSWLAQAPAAAVDEKIGTLLRHPLTVPLGLLTGVLAMTLGWVRMTLSRTAS